MDVNPTGSLGPALFTHPPTHPPTYPPTLPPTRTHCLPPPPPPLPTSPPPPPPPRLPRRRVYVCITHPPTHPPTPSSIRCSEKKLQDFDSKELAIMISSLARMGYPVSPPTHPPTHLPTHPFLSFLPIRYVSLLPSTHPPTLPPLPNSQEKGSTVSSSPMPRETNSTHPPIRPLAHSSSFEPPRPPLPF